MIVKKHGAYWLHSGWFPFNIGFVADAKDWDKVCKYLGVTDAPYCPHSGQCSELVNEDGDLCIIICIKEWDTRSWAEIAGIVAHECSHALETLMRHIGEANPSSEFAAYTIQSFVQDIIECIEDERKKLKKKAKK